MKDLLVGLLVIERELLQIEPFAAGLHDQPQGVVDDGEGGEPEEVHLQQAQLFDRLHVVGGDDFVVLRTMQRNKVGQRRDGEITTPAAWTPEFRTRPSSFLAVSINSLVCGSFS